MTEPPRGTVALIVGAHLGRGILPRQRRLGSQVEVLLLESPQRGESRSGSVSRRTACRCSSAAARVLRISPWTSDCAVHLDARADFSAAAALSTNSVRSSTAAKDPPRTARTDPPASSENDVAAASPDAGEDNAHRTPRPKR